MYNFVFSSRLNVGVRGRSVGSGMLRGITTLVGSGAVAGNTLVLHVSDEAVVMVSVVGHNL